MLRMINNYNVFRLEEAILGNLPNTYELIKYIRVLYEMEEGMPVRLIAIMRDDIQHKDR